MKQLYKFLLLIIVIATSVLPASAQLVVFIDTFDAEVIPGPGGSPAVAYSNILSAAPYNGVQVGGSDFTTSFPFNPGYLNAWGDGSATTTTWAYASAPLSYPVPFTPAIGTAPGPITWEFNMRTSIGSSGAFGATSDEAVVVLVSSSPSFYNLGSGYAVSFTQTAPYSLQLLRFSSGLYGATPTVLIAGTIAIADGTDYTSIRVVFDPATTKWALSFRDDGPFVFSSPFTGAYTSLGSTADATYTSGVPALTHFGFFEHSNVGSSGTTLKYAYFDNYRVSINCGISPFVGKDSVCVGSSVLEFVGNPSGGTWSSLNTAVATVVATSGMVTGVTPGTAVIRYNIPGGCYRDTVMHVIALPDAIVGDTMVCEGGIATVLDASTPGVWASSNTSVATIGSSSGVITSSSPGTSTIIFTSSGTRCSISRIFTVNPVPAAITGTMVVCQGFVTTLSSTTPGGVWISSTPAIATIGTAGDLLGISGGVDTVKYNMAATGCYRTTLVTVNPTPTISGASSLCVGFTTTLTGSVPGGTWSSSNTSVATVSSSGVVSGVGSGPANITYTDGANGCYGIKAITVNPIPAVITGPTVVCQGSTITLADASGSGTWSSGTIGVANIGIFSGIVTGVAGGTSNITYTRFGCTATRGVTVNALPAVITGNSALCMGTNNTLSDITPGGTWISINTAIATIGSTSGIVAPVAPGTSTISYTLTATGCARTVIVTVNALPPANTGTLTVCAGATTTLANTTPGGTWTSGTLSVAVVGATTGVVVGVSGGTSTITFIAPTTCIATSVVTVNPIPAAIGGASSVCVGSVTTLTDVTLNGTWSSSNTSVATIGTSGAVTGVLAGTTTISYTLATGCYVIKTVTVNPLPGSITGTGAICIGITATLGNSTPGGTWGSSNGAIAAVNTSTGVVTGVAAGAATISYFTGSGCYATAVETVQVTPAATITALGNDTVLCPGEFAVLTANTGVGFAYQWFKDGSLIPGAVSATYTATIAGSYRVRVSNGIGCSGMSIPMSVTIATVTADISTASGSFDFCTGSSLTLDATTGTGLTYQWTQDGIALSGATAASYTTGAGGVFAVLITNTVGCTATTSVTATANTTPAGNVSLSGPTTFCSGGSVTMTADISVGYSYQWYNAAGALTGATNASYTTAAAGAYYMTETSAPGCVATSVIVNVVVNFPPSAVVMAGGPIIFCTGGSVPLSATATVGATYQWYRNSVLIAGATGNSYSATTTGGYTIKVTDANGCSATTPSPLLVNVVGTAIVVPLTPSTFCWGGSSLLATNVTGAGSSTVSFQWYLGGVSIAGANSGTYNATVPGLYSVQVAIPSSCTQTTSTALVTEKPLPNPVVAFNSTNNVLSTQTYFVSYQWYKDLVMIPGANGPATIAPSNGNYKVQVTDTNGCQSFSAAFPLTTWAPSGIANVNTNEIKVYPNPAQDNVHVSAVGTVRVVISSMDGRALVNREGTDELDIDLHALANGVYTIGVYRGDTQLAIDKLVKSSK
jgi:uncharacterized protein YjdB